MKFKRINQNEVALKVEPYKDGDMGGFIATALDGLDGGFAPKGWGRTREEAVACFWRCLQPGDRFIKPDVDINERCFTGPISMCAGGVTAGKIQLLHDKLDEAFNCLSGLQQNGGQGTEFDYDFDRMMCEKIQLILEDINVALNVEPAKKETKQGFEFL